MVFEQLILVPEWQHHVGETILLLPVLSIAHMFTLDIYSWVLNAWSLAYSCVAFWQFSYLPAGGRHTTTQVYGRKLAMSSSFLPADGCYLLTARCASETQSGA